MSISYEILGQPGCDNALFVQIDSGQSIDRLLFDCGEGCASSLPFADILALDHLFLSHLHMDHISGFDSFFRCVYNRTHKPNQIWGPPGTGKALHHRFQSFLWNLHEGMSGSWRVTDIGEAATQTTRSELSEAFATLYAENDPPLQAGAEGGQHQGLLLVETSHYTVEAHTMDHRTPSMAYVVREKTRINLDSSRLAAMGLKPGPWVKQLKSPTEETQTIQVDGVEHSAATLREALLVETPGDSLAYLTDFILDEAATARMATVLQGCKTLVCESQYRHADLELAEKNYHMTSVLSARLAQQAAVENLILFHVSDRYNKAEWLELLEEARGCFANTRFPEHWGR